jgi:hypothetical protein
MTRRLSFSCDPVSLAWSGWAHRHHVPLVIFTAGLTNVAQEVLLQKLGPPAACLPIVGNTLYFRDGATEAGSHATAFSEPLVHVRRRPHLLQPSQVLGPCPH